VDTPSHSEQRIARCGFFLEDVEGGARQLPGFERGFHGNLIDQSSACAIDQSRAFFHAPNGLREMMLRVRP